MMLIVILSEILRELTGVSRSLKFYFSSNYAQVLHLHPKVGVWGLKSELSVLPHLYS